MTPQRVSQLLGLRSSTAKALAMTPDDRNLRDTMGFIDKQLRTAGAIPESSEPQDKDPLGLFSQPTGQ
jgi:hypothetical protein